MPVRFRVQVHSCLGGVCNMPAGRGLGTKLGGCRRITLPIPKVAYVASSSTCLRLTACGYGHGSAGLEATVAGSQVCCAPLDLCEQLVNSSIPSPYVPATGTCTNRMNKPSGVLCRAADASKCMQAVTCTGAVASCALDRYGSEQFLLKLVCLVGRRLQ
jgi:hypothetical protein